ncbi:MAG: SDR family oxidoreductase [Deltaproteobacteria bacterium]|nr:SDR family oxidoreductase [Deltaproteobacteria bacterium]
MAERPCVLITGASSGLGSAMATRMLERGWRVFGTSRKPRSVPGPGERSIEWIEMDVCDDASVEAGLAAVFARTPHLDGLVCNAGFGIFGPVEETELERARAQFETNVFGVLRVVRPVLARMRARGTGRILFVGSLAGRAPIPFQAHYSASKAAIEALVFSLANEIHPFGLSVHLIEPGDIDTAFNDVMDWGASAPGSPYAERRERCEKTIRESLPKAPKPSIVADAVEHALTSRRPRLRYAVGNEARLVGLGKRLLSDGLNLKLIRDHFGI